MDDLRSLLFGKFSIFEVTASNYILGKAPDAWQPQIEEAVAYKARGEYLRAAQILTSKMMEEQTLYTQVTDIIFEIAACSGLIKYASQRIFHMIQLLEGAALTHLVPIYEDKLVALSEAFDSEEQLTQYLGALAGNSAYRLPAPFEELKTQMVSAMNDPLYIDTFKKLRVNRHVVLERQPNGSDVVTPTSTSTFMPDGQFVALRALVEAFLAEFNSQGRGLNTSSEPYPPSCEIRIRQAVELKRRGRFLDSAEILVGLSREMGTVYTGVLNALFKTVACAGDLLNANTILMRGLDIYTRSPHGPSVSAGLASNFSDHLGRMLAASESRRNLEEYLRSISGNPKYQLTRGYDDMVTELHSRHNTNAAKETSTNKSETPSGGGCYIATAVYGSYDAPAVLVLRRFRDESLATTAMGRVFIRFYYAASPAMARHLAYEGTATRLVRGILDAAVRRLEK